VDYLLSGIILFLSGKEVVSLKFFENVVLYLLIFIFFVCSLTSFLIGDFTLLNVFVLGRGADTF